MTSTQPRTCSSLGLVSILAAWGAAPAVAQDAEVAAPGRPAPTLEIRVDRRVELLAIVARLAGFPEYRQPIAESAYTRSVDAAFAAFAGHPVFEEARRLRRERGLGYDAVASLAVHLTPELEEAVDFVWDPGRLAPRWSGEEARTFAALVRGFAEASSFERFFAEHEELYRLTEERLRERLAGWLEVAWFDRWFGVEREARFALHPSLLVGSNNFGVGVRPAEGPESLTPVIGVWKYDAEGLPLFDESVLPIVVHEFAHSYVNPLFDRRGEEFRAAGDVLFPRVEAIMASQAYSSWGTVLNESVVRAVVVRYFLERQGEPAAEAQAREDLSQGFEWIGSLASLLGRYEASRERFGRFEDFVPRVASHFDELAEAERKAVLLRPKLVSITPANGDEAVDPASGELVLVFDRPMRDRSWSILGEGAPEFLGAPSYDAERKVLRAKIRLAPGRSYRFWLNGPANRGFQSADGTSLDPIEVRFRTRE